MMSLREQLLNGLIPTAKPVQAKIPRKSEFKGTITEDGYCDYDVQEEDWFLYKSNSRLNRMHQSSKARNNRKQLKTLLGKSHH